MCFPFHFDPSLLPTLSHIGRGLAKYNHCASPYPLGIGRVKECHCTNLIPPLSNVRLPTTRARDSREPMGGGALIWNHKLARMAAIEFGSYTGRRVPRKVGQTIWVCARMNGSKS